MSDETRMTAKEKSLISEKSEDTPDSLPRKTRKGEVFLPPSEVQLHCTDFAFSDAAQEHSAVLEAFKKKLDGMGMPPAQPPSGSKPPCPAVLSEAMQQEMFVLPPGSAMNYWEWHYKTNRNNFFPVKNYMIRAFPSLVPDGMTVEELAQHEGGEATVDEQKDEGPVKPRVIMEAGCGNGSAILPLMKVFPNDIFICHDISSTAVALLGAHQAAKHHLDKGRLSTFELNIATQDLPASIAGGQYLTTDADGKTTLQTRESSANAVYHPGCVDKLLLSFVLCALQPHEMITALKRLQTWLKPKSGELLFRDYGVLDHNLMRFMKNGNKEAVDGNLAFVKGDATTQFFFEEQWTKKLFEEAGLKCKLFEYHCNRVVNRKDGKRMDKVFVNAVFYREE